MTKSDSKTKTDEQVKQVYLYLINEDEKEIVARMKSLPAEDASRLKVLKKIAEQVDEKEFIKVYKNNETPAVKLNAQEQELIKGGRLGMWGWIIDMILTDLLMSDCERYNNCA